MAWHWRFRRSYNLDFARLNLFKTGLSATFGGRGARAHITAGTAGVTRSIRVMPGLYLWSRTGPPVTTCGRRRVLNRRRDRRPRACVVRCGDLDHVDAFPMKMAA
jgi:hypothetical protein